MAFSGFSSGSRKKKSTHAVLHLGNREPFSIIVFPFGILKVTMNSDILFDVKEPRNIWQSLQMPAFTSPITYDHNHVWLCSFKVIYRASYLYIVSVNDA